MDRNKRIEYLVVTMVVFVTGFIAYGFGGSMAPMEYTKLEAFLMFGLLGGGSFSMVVSTLILASRYFAKKSFKFKVIAAIFWILTFGIVAWVGLIIYIPYQIYNIVKIFSDKSREIDESSQGIIEP